MRASERRLHVRATSKAGPARSTSSRRASPRSISLRRDPPWSMRFRAARRSFEASCVHRDAEVGAYARRLVRCDSEKLIEQSAIVDDSLSQFFGVPLTALVAGGNCLCRAIGCYDARVID